MGTRRQFISGVLALPHFNVRDHGARGDGSTPDTVALQRAIDACAAGGGGLVVLPQGRYLTGTLALKDGVGIHLSPRAVLLGSRDIADYPAQRSSYPEGPTEAKRALIWAKGASRVAIEGRGSIDGQGAAFERKGPRPKMIYMEDCRDVLVRDVTLRNSAVYQSHFVACDRLAVRGVTIDGWANWNSDGIDVDGCQDVLISDCNVSCSDDAICLKSGLMRPSKNVVVTNCIVRTRWGAIKFGTASQGGFENVTVSNCAIHDTWGCGIKLLLVDGGKVDNVTITNITMDNVTGPIFLRLGDRGSKFGQERGLPVGSFRNVLISNIRARVADTVYRDISQKSGASPAERIGSIIAGIPGHLIENVALENIHVTYPGGGTAEEARRRNIPEQEKAYPEYRIFGPTPAFGFYVRHARGVSFRNVRLETMKPDARPAILCDDVEHLDIAGLSAPAGDAGQPAVVLRDTREAFVRDCRTLGEARSFVRVEGGASRDITVAGNLLRRVKTPVETADGAEPGSVRETGNLS